jgi:hypothetical protein
VGTDENKFSFSHRWGTDEHGWALDLIVRPLILDALRCSRERIAVKFAFFNSVAMGEACRR